MSARGAARAAGAERRAAGGKMSATAASSAIDSRVSAVDASSAAVADALGVGRRQVGELRDPGGVAVDGCRRRGDLGGGVGVGRDDGHSRELRVQRRLRRAHLLLAHLVRVDQDLDVVRRLQRGAAPSPARGGGDAKRALALGVRKLRRHLVARVVVGKPPTRRSPPSSARSFRSRPPSRASRACPRDLGRAFPPRRGKSSISRSNASLASASRLRRLARRRARRRRRLLRLLSFYSVLLRRGQGRGRGAQRSTPASANNWSSEPNPKASPTAVKSTSVPTHAFTASAPQMDCFGMQ